MDKDVLKCSRIDCIFCIFSAPTGVRAELDLDAFIKRLLHPRAKQRHVCISEDEILSLCCTSRASFLQQETLLKLKSPIKICGDVHGQYRDLLKLFRIGGCPSETPYLFLGDYVDRGPNSLETICLLLALKSKYPQHFYLIRGNHEVAPINRIFGFHSEMRKRYKRRNFLKLYFKFNDTFNYMPLAALIDGNVFCCHGGLSPLLTSMKSVNGIVRPVYPTNSGLATDLLWSDPDDTIQGWEKQDQPERNPRHRGMGYLWGWEVHKKFLKKNKLKLVIRAHECVDRGYQWHFDKQLLTMFSAPNYSERNLAAIASYHRDGTVTFSTFH